MLGSVDVSLEIKRFILLLAVVSVSILGPLKELPTFLLKTKEAVYPEANGFE
jgi:hypothetical protein